MPVEPKVIKGKVRTVESETGKVAETAKGNAMDGGGWPTNKYGWGKARRQAMHVNEKAK